MNASPRNPVSTDVPESTAAEPDAEKILQEEIDSYQKEQGAMDDILGKIGGVQSRKKERVINVLILFVIIAVFVVDIVFELFDPIYAVEFGILLISVKIIMLISSLSRMSHFNFWVLHSIEQRLNAVSRRIEGMEKQLQRNNDRN